MVGVRLQDLSRIDVYQNELDFQYSQSKLLKYVVLCINYQALPPFFRNAMAKLLYKRGSQKNRDFPIDRKVDALKLVGLRNRFAACFTHDIETKYDFERGIDLLRGVEEEHGINSTWAVAPRSRNYEVNVETLKRLEELGNEIAVHGMYHDGRFAFVGKKEREERIKKGRESLRSMGFKAEGFRTPWLHRTRDLIPLLEKHRYVWDSSFPDTDPSTIGYEGTGCSTVFPFYPLLEENGTYRYSTILELPITIPQDWALIHSLGYSNEEVLKLWKEKVDYVEDIGGLALFLTHPSHYDMGNPKRLWIYDEIIKYVLEKEPFIGTCREIVKLWKSQSESSEMSQQIWSDPL